jgi:S-formylglutathione hydrolase FrmB
MDGSRDRTAQARRTKRRRAIALVSIALVTVALVFALAGGDQHDLAHPKQALTAHHAATRERITINSRAIGRRLPADVLLPRDFDEARRRPILVFMHGRGAAPEHLSGGAMLEALDAAGPRAPIVVVPYGGESYWHDRADGGWGSWITDEVVPAVARKYKVDRRRVALAGHSMGGFGALNLARLHPGRYCAAGGHSPALWQTGGETAAGAFDGAEDFARNDVIGVARNNPSAFRGARVWIDAGVQDPFQPGVQAMVAALRAGGIDVTAHTWAGGHTGEYSDKHLAQYLRFYTRVLAACRR